MTLANTEDTDWYLLVPELGAKIISSDIEVCMLDSAVKQSMPKDCLSAIPGGVEYEELLPPRSVVNEGGFDTSDQDINGWLSLIREGLHSIPSVEDIFISIEGSDVDVWVVIPERDLAILHQIVEAEGELFDTLVSGENSPFLMDFHIIYRRGRNIEDLAPTKAIRLPR